MEKIFWRLLVELYNKNSIYERIENDLFGVYLLEKINGDTYRKKYMIWYDDNTKCFGVAERGKYFGRRTLYDDLQLVDLINIL